MTNIKNTILGIFNFMLTSERINSQRCVAKDIDTSKTIIDTIK